MAAHHRQLGRDLAGIFTTGNGLGHRGVFGLFLGGRAPRLITIEIADTPAAIGGLLGWQAETS
jgi:hypothetical protein